jgi:hypothetical protein
MIKKRIIGVDFDGTCVTHEFPKIGRDIGAVPVLKKLTEVGHRLILFTMRSDIELPESNSTGVKTVGGNYLSEAIDWFASQEIPLFGVNENPEQHTWTKSPKPYCDLYIDDAALGCPLVFNPRLHERPFVDWVRVARQLTHLGYSPIDELLAGEVAF